MKDFVVDGLGREIPSLTMEVRVANPNQDVGTIRLPSPGSRRKVPFRLGEISGEAWVTMPNLEQDSANVVVTFDAEVAVPQGVSAKALFALFGAEVVK